MSQKRIILSVENFLLYSELVLHCYGEKPSEDFDGLLSRLSQAVNTNLTSGSIVYFDAIAKRIKKQGATLERFYGKITTEIKSQKRSSVAFNLNGEIADCYKYIRSKYPDVAGNLSIQQFVASYLSLNKQSLKSNAKESAPQIANAVELLRGTIWYLYYHEYDASPKTRHTVISRLLLVVDENLEIKLYDHKESRDFIGTIDPLCASSSSLIIVNLERRPPKVSSKKLQLRIIIEDGVTSDSVLLGQYIDFESGNKIVGGTFVIEQATKESLTARNPIGFTGIQKRSKYFRYRQIELSSLGKIHIIQIKLFYDSGWERFIPREIAEYLSNKWKNHTKTKPLVNSSLAGLDGWLKDQILKERARKEKYDSIIEYDCFLITPIGSIIDIAGMPYFQEINEHFFKTPKPTQHDLAITDVAIYESCDLLKSMGTGRIYYTPRVKKIKEPSSIGDDDSQSIVSEDISAMNKSRYIVFIVPDLDQSSPHRTSAFIKIGWAMEQAKPIIIFPLAPGLLPKLLTQSHIHNIHISETTRIQDIPLKLKNEFSQILEP